MVYSYNADLICDDCAQDTIARLNAEAIEDFRAAHPDAVIDPNDPDDIAICLGFDPADEYAFDSGSYPKACGDVTGGESDTPTHCARCGEFQGNTLTEDGLRYVIEAIAENTGNAETLRLWYDEYLEPRELRDVEFRPLNDGTVYRLRTFDLWRSDRDGKRMIAYIFGVDGEPALFSGDDLHVAPAHAIDSDECLRELMGFLTLRPGDTDREYFDRYTPEQSAFAATYACETLQLWADESSRMPIIDYGQRVWVRVDDSGDYHPFAWVTEAGQFVAETLCADPVTRDARAAGGWEVRRAVNHPDYRGVSVESQNVPSWAEFRADVSLFWGDADAHFDRELRDDELDDFTEAVICADVD